MHLHSTSLGPLIIALSITTSNVVPILTTRGAEPDAVLNSSPVPGSREMKLDQVNIAGWNRAWTNLVNIAEQSFTPSMPHLMAVEVELLVGNPGPSQDDLTLTVLNQQGDELVSVTQDVKTSNCQHTVFVLPNGGIDVNAGSTYRIRLKGGIIFGWKYVMGGYPKGEATFNGKPLVPKARSTFLFRTFGSE